MLLQLGLLTGIAGAALVLGTAAGLGAPLRALGAQEGTRATMVLRDLTGTQVGVGTFTQQGGRVLVQVETSGLPAGFHGFHVHAVGDCDASTSFMSAGGHYNPMSMSHADHGGDMPSLYVLGDGSANLGFTTDRFTVDTLLGGRALIVHADPDNFANIPARYGVTLDETTLATGDAGGRIACGTFVRG
jgi:Cu-Zn family superoxide dismutase